MTVSGRTMRRVVSAASSTSRAATITGRVATGWLGLIRVVEQSQDAMFRADALKAVRWLVSLVGVDGWCHSARRPG